MINVLWNDCLYVVACLFNLNKKLLYQLLTTNKLALKGLHDFNKSNWPDIQIDKTNKRK